MLKNNSNKNHSPQECVLFDKSGLFSRYGESLSNTIFIENYHQIRQKNLSIYESFFILLAVIQQH